MTNTEIIATIRNEIERQISDLPDTWSGSPAAKWAFEALLSFLSTLEQSEKPMNPEDAMKELDEKIALVKRRGTWDGVDVDKYMDEVRGRESEKPMNQDELEEEIQSFWNRASGFQPKFATLEVKENGFATIARHFAKWGAENLK